MPTSERRFSGLAVAATLMLAAGGLAQAAWAGPATRTRVNVAGQAVTIAAPAGFCVDQKSTMMTTAGAFVLMSDCSLLGGRTGKPPVGAALTASVSNGGLAGEGDSGQGGGDTHRRAQADDSLHSFPSLSTAGQYALPRYSAIPPGR